MSIKRPLSLNLVGLVTLLGLVTFSLTTVNAQSTSTNLRQHPTITQPVKSIQPLSQFHYHRNHQKGTGTIYQPHYGFSKQLNRKAKFIHGWYGHRIHYNQIARNPQNTFVKTKKGWLNQKAFNQFLITRGKLNYQMRVIHNGSLYNLPAHTNHAKKIGNTASLNLLHRWVNVNACANTNLNRGFYRFNYRNRNYWIHGNNLMFNLRALRSHNKKLENVISTGERLINHSKYNEKTRHYDCSSFLSHLYAKAGHYIGSTTYSQIYSGQRANLRHLKRGDLVFFNTIYSTDAYGHKISGRDCHVAMYLGHGLILQDSPDDDNDGVDVSSLHDPMWNSRSKYPEVHKLNGIARRIM